MCDDDWVKVAMSDDSLVVDMLLRLYQAPPPPHKTSPSLHLHWTVRQRRSRSAPRHVGASDHKKDEPTRASPTTPLSWSGATTASGGAAAAPDGSEESSRPMKLVNTSRSKELASLRLTLEKHRETNERLKRLKVDFESRQQLKTDTTSVAPDKAMADQPKLVDTQCRTSHSLSPTNVPRIVVDNASTHVPPASDSCKPQEINTQEASFVLPDLNLPVDDDLNLISAHGLC